MKEIKRYEKVLSEIYVKFKNHEPLRQDDKIDFYLAIHRINLRLYQLEQSPELKEKYGQLASTALQKVNKLERRVGIIV